MDRMEAKLVPGQAFRAGSAAHTVVASKGLLMSAHSDWHTEVFPLQKPIAVAKLVASHGMDAAIERWSHVDARTIYNLDRAGRKQPERRQK